MSKTKVIEENGVRITLIYEIVDEDKFNSLVEESDCEEPDAHPFNNGPKSLANAQRNYEYYKDLKEYYNRDFSLVEEYAFQEVFRRKIEEYKSGVRKADPVYMLYEDLLPYFKVCYGDISYRIKDDSGYYIYHIVAECYDGFSKVIKLFQHKDYLEAAKMMEEIIENALQNIPNDY